ncbi:ABC transporter ATP-binding protein [uncultured Roseibium sp.]|uniref:ABC transporter ATP-binding protein n=1 Tax=uncultured Roseibium sp. TaxID=1936171 RepID=UPI00260C7078|nr:ABC transporter ATP-binding protein [uncultured Roseibium sp.]
MIEVRDLAVDRGGKRILEAYGFHLESGSVLSILGANGVGKTTLLGTLIGLLKPAGGKVAIDGRIGFVPQLFEVPFSYSALDIALMGRARHLGLFGSPGAKDYEIVRRCFSMLGITKLEHQTFNSLSGGQRQLVMIAQALGSECDLLILDEPCAALDYKNQDKVLALLAQLQKDHGMTIVFTTHMPQHAVEVASHVLLMTSGRDFLFGPVPEILNAANLSDLYALPIGRAEFTDRPKHTFAPLFRSGETASDV